MSIVKCKQFVTFLLTCLNKRGIFKLFKQVGITWKRKMRKEGNTMGKYENDVQRLLTLVGGKENIQAVSHCMTRMRFVLVDAKKADEMRLKNCPASRGHLHRQDSIR